MVTARLQRLGHGLIQWLAKVSPDGTPGHQLSLGLLRSHIARQDINVHAARTSHCEGRRLAVTARVLLLSACAAACSVTLDPTISPAPADDAHGSPGGSAGEGGKANVPEPNPACVPVNGASVHFVVCAPPLPRTEASANCAAQGGKLASIRSASDNDALAAVVANSAETTNVWLGGMRDEMHFWSWPNGSIFWHGRFDGAAPEGVFTNFLAGEPNNTASTTEASEACLAQTVSGGWNDRACELALSYVCELSL